MKRFWIWAVVAVLAAAVWSGFAHPWGWAFAIGVHPYPGPQTPWTYQLFSGFLPALTVVSLLGAVSSLWHLKNCHEDGCWRIGKHVVNGSPWCNRHVAKVTPERTENEILLSMEASLIQLVVLLKTRAP